MNKECVVEGPSIEEAVDAALEELGVQQDAVKFEVLEQSGGGLLGLGGPKVVKVKVWIKDEYVAVIETAKEAAAEIIDVDEELPAALKQMDTPELSDEDLDKVADTAAESLKTIVALLGVDAPSVEEYEGDEGEIILDVVGGDLGLLIGRHGRTLDALQAAVGAITTRSLGFRYPVVVDVEGYRHRRRQKVEEVARRAADRATRSHQAVRLRPMTAYERRIVHVTLRDDRRVTTTSEGQDPYRQVVVLPV